MNSLEFKNEKIFLNFTTHPMHRKLGKLLWWWLGQFYEAVVTSSFRENDNGVHGQTPFRGVDLRCWIYSNPEGMADYINDIFTYDPKRPKMKCCILHEVNKKGKHFHLQVHDRSLINGRNF